MDKISTVIPNLGKEGALVARSNAEVDKAKNLVKRELKSKKELNKATSGFEALLLHQMLKAMWSTVETTGVLGENTFQAQIYRDMFSQAIADTVSEGRGIGIKSFLGKELKKIQEHASVSPEKASKK